jgi:hypothetical protein
MCRCSGVGHSGDDPPKSDSAGPAVHFYAIDAKTGKLKTLIRG